MEKAFQKVIVSLCLILVPIVAVGADGLLVYEGFDLTGQATLDPRDYGATSFGFVEGWEVPVGTSVALGTDGASLPGPAGYGATTADGRLDDAGNKVIKREFDNIALDLNTEGDEYWISMLAQKTVAVPASSAYMYMLLQDTTVDDNPGNAILNGICMGYASSSKADISINYLYPLGANRVQSLSPLSENSQLFVAKITTHSIAAGGTTDNDEYTLWTFDAATDTISETAPEVAAGLSIVNDATTNNLSLNKISIGTLENTDFQLDEIRIGTSWASVTGVTFVPLPANDSLVNGDFSDGLDGWQTFSDASTTEPEMAVADGVATISRANGADAWATGVIYQVVNVPEGTKVRVDGEWAGDQSALGGSDMWWGEVAVFSAPELTEEKLADVFDYPGYLQNYIAEGETNRGGSYAAATEMLNSFGSAYPSWAMEDIDNSQYDWEAAKAAFEAAGHTWDPEQRLEYNFTEVESCGQVVVALKYGGGSPAGSISFDNITLTVVPDYIAGDANGDGKVDGSDVTILAGNWQAGVGAPDPTNITWEMGDFNGDGQIDGSDVTILAGNWQAGVTPASTAVPEPSILAMLVALALPMMLRRRVK